MSVLDQPALEASPLADLHALASELSIDGFRRLRREALIEAILERQGGAPARPRRRSSRSTTSPTPARTRSRSKASRPPETAADEAEATGEDEPEAREPEAREPESREPESRGPEPRESEGEEPRRRRGRRGGRARTAEPSDADGAAEAEPEAGTGEPSSRSAEGDAEVVVEGVVELLPNGSAFVRVSPPDPSDDDVYVSAAQVKRCELVSGDRIAGPRRAPRRSERFASLVRVDTINGAPAAETADGARFDDLPAEFPGERLKLGAEDPTIKAIEWLTPIGRGSRVTIVGGPRAGKTETLRRLAAALTSSGDELQCTLALAGVRPEEIGLWGEEPLRPVTALSFAASADAQDHAVELVVDQARRIAARGAHAVVLIDTLDGMHPHAARRALAAARNLTGGGSLTVIATASEPLGGETTVIALDPRLASTGRFPALDLVASGTIRPELLVGEAGAEAIAAARAQALEDA